MLTLLLQTHIDPVPHLGGVAERSNATDCKSVGVTLRWFESSPLHQIFKHLAVVWCLADPEFTFCAYLLSSAGWAAERGA
jgi:hypothetical protein